MNFKPGDMVYVKNWGQIIRDFYSQRNGNKKLIFNWITPIPDYSSIEAFTQRVYKPKLTLKGTPYKNGEQILISEIPAYKNFEYKILEITKRPIANDFVYLIASKEGCYVQILEKGLTTLTPTEQARVAHLEKEKYLQALAKDNLGKWTTDVKKEEFPKELLKYLYDENQTVQFGPGMTKGCIKYPYIPKEYMVTGNDYCLGWETLYNGIGCSLEGKETITWNKLKDRFPDNIFEG